MISSPSPPRRVGEAFSGLTIEDRRAMTPLGPARDAHAARGLGATAFVPTGEALLSEELDLPGHGARGGPARAGASRDLAAEMHTPDAARGLLLGRTATIGASGDLTELDISFDRDLDDDDDDDDDAGGTRPASSDPRAAKPRRGTRCLLFGGTVEGDMDHDEEVYVRGRHVVWSAGGCVRVRFTAPEPVRQALWCRFDDGDGSTPEPTLCLRHDAAMTTYAPSGTSHTVPLTRDPRDLRACAAGLLVPTKRGLAALTHPLDRAELVVPGSIPGGDATGSIPHGVDDARTFAARVGEVVWSSARSPFILTHDANRGAHALWRVDVKDSVCHSDGNAANAPFDDEAGRDILRASGLADGPRGTSGGRREMFERYAFAQHGRVAATRVWTEPNGTSKEPHKWAALAHDDEGAPTIATLCESTREVVGWRLDGDGSGPPVASFRVPDVASFVAVAATRGEDALDILAIHENSGRLALRCGGRAVFEWPGTCTLGATGARVSQVRSLHSAVGGRCTATLDDGGSVRLAAPTPPRHPASRALLETLDASLRGGDRAEAMSLVLAATAQGRGDKDAEWALASTAVARWCGCGGDDDEEDGFFWGGDDPTVSDEPILGDFGSDDDEDDDAAWNALLAHQQRLGRGRGRGRGRGGLDRPDDDDSYDDEEPLPPELASRAFDVMVAAHAAYESSKLDSLRRPALAPLNALCTSLATTLRRSRNADIAAIAAGYLEHHGRDAGAVAGATTYVRASPMGPVPDVTAALELALTGARTETWAGLVPPAVAAEMTAMASRGDDDGDASGGDGGVHGGVTGCVSWAAAVVSFVARAAESSVAAAAGDRETATASARGVALAMTRAGFGAAELARVPSGLGLTLRDALQRCKRSPPLGWPAAAYSLVGRDDLASAAVEGGDGNGDVKSAPGDGRRRRWRASVDVRMRAVPGGFLGDDDDGADGDEDGDEDDEKAGEREPDGMGHLEAYVGPLLFGRDRRLREVRALLESTRPTAIWTAGSDGGGQGGGQGGDGDPEAVTAQQARLWSLAPRTSALAVGRGAFTLGTSRARPTESLRVPTLTLAGCLPAQRGATVKLDLAAASPSTDFTAWPEFHNGAAAGLALAARTKGELTRAWIVFNRPREPSHAHAGVLMALGLTGHLRKLTNTDLYRYLVQEHDATTLGVLVGVAAARRGSMNPDASKMCFLHLPTRHPSAFPEVELSPAVQAAALLSVGLLYEGTAHRLMSEILLAEIGRDPGGDGAAHGREAYALAAGLALGLVTLGRGRAAVGLADLQIPERLRRFLGGGSEPGGEGLSVQGIAMSRQPGGAGGDNARVGAQAWEIGEAEELEAIASLAGGVNDRDRGVPPGEDQVAASTSGGQVMEGNMINLDVTAPGATLALGLMFMRTGDEGVASHLRVPSTHFALEHARPDFILLRVVAHSLVMWNSIRPTMEWVWSNLPPLLRVSLEPPGELEASMRATEDLGRRAGGAVDREAIAQAHVHALAGACMSLGLRYAGTADATAAATLREMTLRFVRLKSRCKDGPHGGLGALIDRPTLETCVGVAAVALSCVMAGTGDLASLRLLRRLRLRLDASGGGGANGANGGGAGQQGSAAAAAAEASSGGGGASGLSHGAHMAIGMAIGFLFLGGGTRTFATDNGSVAALLIATYPRFPQNTGDQRCHLQAFRHLYALAARSRLLQTVDAATQRPVYAPLELTVKKLTGGASSSPGRTAQTRGENADPNVSAAESSCDKNSPENHPGAEPTDETETVHATAPCLLPEEDRLVRLRVVGDRYWPVEVDLSTTGPHRAAAIDLLYLGRRLPVQRLTGALPYAADPTGARAGLARALHAAAAASLRPPRVFVSTQGAEDDDDDARVGVAVRASTYGSSALEQDAVGVFTSDPALLGFKRLMCGRIGSDDIASAELAEFCRAALHECMTREDAGALPAYVDLHASVASLISAAASESASHESAKSGEAAGWGTRETSDAAAAIGHSLTACDVRLLAAYSAGTRAHGTPAQGGATMSASLAAGFHASVAEALENLGYEESGARGLLRRYLLGEDVQDGGGLFGCYLRFHGMPSPGEVRAALAVAGVGAPGAGLDPDAVVPALATGLPGTPPQAILRIARCGL